MTANQRIYLALGDSMSIDDYTGVKGGGAVRQFYKWLGEEKWLLDDRTFDGCRMQEVLTVERGALITLTIGGNDLLWNREKYLSEGLASFAEEHQQLLQLIRQANPQSLLIVGDIYAPQGDLSLREVEGLAAANAAIRENCQRVDARLAPIHDAFLGHEMDYLCKGIEPTLQGAEVIAGLFRELFAE